MPLIYACILPHSPLLLPSIGKERRNHIPKTLAAFDHVHKKLLAKKPDAVVVLSSHAEQKRGRENSFLLNAPKSFTASFEMFGDLITKATFESDTLLAADMKQELAHAGVPVSYEGAEMLNYSASIPLLLALQREALRIVVVTPSGTEEPPLLFSVGEALRSCFQQSPKKIAVIASADLAHCLTDDAPLPFSEEGALFDQDILRLLKKKNCAALLELHASAHRVGACGFPSLSILSGILDGLAYRLRFLSYEGSLGIGHVAMEYTF